VPTAFIEFDFDPLLRAWGLTARVESVALATAILIGLLVAAVLAGRIAAAAVGSADAPRSLRRDDLLLIAIGALPGAVVGGRAGHALAHVDFYAADIGRLFDPSVGSAELGLAVVGGALSGTVVARLLDGSPGAWLRVAALPVLLVIGLGKLSMALGGRGQGTPADLPWATAYLGPGPWGSLGPAIPSHPSQVYEALVAFAAIAIVVLLLRTRAFRRLQPAPFLAAVGVWSAGRAAVAETWRDPEILGPLGAAQLIALALAAGCLLAFALLLARPARDVTGAARGEPPHAEPVGASPR
jgi:prolipoprotein diacylglyceryltransferase